MRNFLRRPLFSSINLALANAFNTEAPLCSECRNVRLDRIENAFAVILLSELRHQPFTLNLAHESIRQITFDVTTHLRVVLAILNRDYQQETRLVAVF